MRVKLSTNPPLPPLRAWFPLASPSTGSVSSFKSLLCATLPAFRGLAPSSLRLSIDGFDLLDTSDLSVVRDGDLISADLSCKRKRRPSSSESESESTSSSSASESESSDSESTSDSDSATRAEPAQTHARAHVEAHTHVAPPARPVSSTFVPPGYGKPQTRSRNLRRRLKRMHGREAVQPDEPASGANAVEGLLSLSLRNKNKAKNFRSLVSRPLAPKIVFSDLEQPQPPRLIPPSSRASLPENVFVTSVDVEAGMHREKKKRKMRAEYDDAPLDYGEADVDQLEATADSRWATLERPTRDKVAPGALVGYKALGIDPVTCTPGLCLTVGHVTSCDDDGLVVRPLQGASFGGPVGEADRETEVHTWDDVIHGDWRMCQQC